MKSATPIAAVLIGLACGVTTAKADVIGGFDLSRGGEFSLRDSASLSGLRTAITSAFPGDTLSANGTLTPAYLSSINTLFISSATGNTTATSPLSASEQTALTNFVLAGGSALIFVDNDTFAGGASPTANNSFLSPFGLHVTGTLNGTLLADPD
jgi:hypothetical protein